MTPTLLQIAEIAKVSPSTVSQVVRNVGRISPETRRRVMRVVQEKGYRPSRGARVLRRQRNMVISLPLDSTAITSNISRHGAALLMVIILGVSKYVQQHGYHLHLVGARPGEDFEVLRSQVLSENAIDGVVLLGYGDREACASALPPLLRQMRQCGLPAVTRDHHIARMGVPLVTICPDAAMRAAAQRIRQFGHTRAAYVGPIQPNHSESRSRFEAFRSALQAEGISLLPDDVCEARSDVETYAFIASAHHRLPRCIIFGSDRQALAGLQVLNSLGYRVPESFSVLGFDNAPYTSGSGLELATIDRQFEAVGLELARLLIQQLETPEVSVPAVSTIEAVFLDRASLGPSPPSGTS